METSYSSAVTLREVIDGFQTLQEQEEWREDSSSFGIGNAWDDERSEECTLEQEITIYVQEHPGRSRNAIFRHCKKRGYSYSAIEEGYNVLVYDKKVIQRLNVGTSLSPRYAHFFDGFQEQKRDALCEILGPM
ncbi:MAG: hypothetical protein WBA22_13640 [Candidatus Methanofastidiosia archaeon]